MSFTTTYNGASTTVTVVLPTEIETKVAAAIKYFEEGGSLYGKHMIPSLGGNLAFVILFAIAFVIHIILSGFYKQRWIGVCMFFGTGLEIIGYAARVIAHNKPSDENAFLAQIICLTIAPCFIMAVYYYLLAKFVVIFSPKYSMLAPIYYSYIFIACDIISLVLQGGGGGKAGTALENNTETDSGTHIMLGGLAFQVLSMCIFLVFFINFFYNIYFGCNKELPDISNHWFHLAYKEHLFNPEYKNIRQKKSFKYLPFVVFLGTIFIFTRCIYRVVELSQGWDGFLITHEKYVFVLDGMMILLACFVFIFLYPGYVFGRNNKVIVPKALSHKKQNQFIQQTLNQQNAGNEYKSVSS